MFVFEEERKPVREPREKPSEQGKNQRQTQSNMALAFNLEPNRHIGWEVSAPNSVLKLPPAVSLDCINFCIQLNSFEVQF